MPTAIAIERTVFRALYMAGCFVMPDPRDVGSALWPAGQGFDPAVDMPVHEGTVPARA